MTSDGPARAALANELTAASNPTGGWSYAPGKASRLEPTCWGLLALPSPSQGRATQASFLTTCQRPDGWLVENAEWPVNIAFNALVAFTWLNHRDLAADDQA